MEDSLLSFYYHRPQSLKPNPSQVLSSTKNLEFPSPSSLLTNAFKHEGASSLSKVGVWLLDFAEATRFAPYTFPGSCLPVCLCLYTDYKAPMQPLVILWINNVQEISRQEECWIYELKNHFPMGLNIEWDITYFINNSKHVDLIDVPLDPVNFFNVLFQVHFLGPWWFKLVVLQCIYLCMSINGTITYISRSS